MPNPMNRRIDRKAIVFGSTLLTAASLLSACGGSSSSASSSPDATASVAITDAPSSNYTHVWLTVNAVWFHPVETAQPGDGRWVKFPLSAPETIDLVALTNGNLATVFTGLNLPAGTYRQIRLFLTDSSAALTPSAAAAALQFNDEVDTTVSGNLVRTELETVTPEDGIGLDGTFTATSGQPLNLALDFDVNNDVIGFASGSSFAYVLDPVLHYWDLATVGAVTGQINPAALYSSSTNPSGAYYILITAQNVESSGVRHAIRRATTVTSDGHFTLFPVDVPSGSTTANYDIVLAGDNMQTTVITGVPVTAGTGPEAGQNPTLIQADPIDVVYGSAQSYFLVNLSADAPLTPTAGHVGFYQTLPGSGNVPYVIQVAPSDPFTETLAIEPALSTTNIASGAYNSGSDITLASVEPQEGTGSFSTLANANLYAPTSGSSVSAALVPEGATEVFTVSPLPVNSPAVADSISGTLTQSTAGNYNAGYLAVIHNGLIVTTIDLAGVLAQAGGNGGSFTINDVPGGSSSASDDSAKYYIYARVWNTSNVAGTLSRRSLGTIVDLSGGSATGLSLNLN